MASPVDQPTLLEPVPMTPGAPPLGIANLLDRVDFFRLDASRKLDRFRRAEMGQFFTPAPTARLMASMFRNTGSSLHLLDAGAGIGSLTAAWIAEICTREHRPKDVHVTAYELELTFLGHLAATLHACEAACQQADIKMTWDLVPKDFIEDGVEMLTGSLFGSAPRREFTTAILNPPYRKINAGSRIRSLLSRVAIETSNLYTAFLALVVQLLKQNGELVAISPRSFCNGPYFRSFRRTFFSAMTLCRLHVFESRDHAFRDDQVLQENVILHALKADKAGDTVLISSGSGPEDDHLLVHEVAHDRVVRPDDPHSFVYIVPHELGHTVGDLMAQFTSTLADLDVQVSTGRVVDFRSEIWLRPKPNCATAPLIYPAHCRDRIVTWPLESTRKPQAIVESPETMALLVPAGWYVLVKRFSAKEERRRVVATVYDPTRIDAARLGFENHLNYYHRHGRPLSSALARGLALFLNSTVVDEFFRQFSGHTQVNATDLRSLGYPGIDALEQLGDRVRELPSDQVEVDRLVREDLMSAGSQSTDPVHAKEKIEQALVILRALGLPRGQQNERSALVLLALLSLKPDTAWSRAGGPLLGVTPIMDFIAEHYGRRYAPNTRETVRRQTIHQFLDAGLLVANPDLPSRPVNSPKAVYQIEGAALDLLRTFVTDGWDKGLRTYLTSVDTLTKRYARERDMVRIPLRLGRGQLISLSPGGQNILIEKIITEFCPRFTPSAQPVYVGDTDQKWAHFDESLLRQLGVSLDSHGKMPDVVVYYGKREWLVLIEAVTSHGPVDAKRRAELKRLFAGSKVGLVYVTAFLTRRTMARYLNDISWETEVWVAEAPSHLIHFNGERFLGPHET